MANILLVEDEPLMRLFLRTCLRSNGYRLIEVGTAALALEAVPRENPNVILLDLGLPDADGVEVTRKVREWSRIPIIVISARGHEEDKVKALDAGADDYVTKPFGDDELLARIRVALRHSTPDGPPSSGSVVEIGPLRIDLSRMEVKLSGETVHLTPIEYRLLVVLAQHAGTVLTHRQILSEVWGAEHEHQTNYLRVYMTQLRRKIDPGPQRPRILVTEPGVGYGLRDPTTGEKAP